MSDEKHGSFYVSCVGNLCYTLPCYKNLKTGKWEEPKVFIITGINDRLEFKVKQVV